MKIEVGKSYIDNKKEVHRVVAVSPRSLHITTRNDATGENGEFKHSWKTDTYIKSGARDVILVKKAE